MKNILVCVSDCSDSKLIKKFFLLSVPYHLLLLSMNVPIYFNDYFLLWTEKISNVGTNPMLTSEF